MRVASAEDLPRVVAWLLQQPPSVGHRWALEPVETDHDARRSLLEWVVHSTFDGGLIVVDDRGPAIGGRQARLFARTGRRLASGRAPTKPSKTIGRWQYPADLPEAVHERLFRLARAIELVTPPLHATRASFGLDVDGGVSDGLWTAWTEQVAPAATVAITIGEDGKGDLHDRGFVRAGQQRVRGESALLVTSWVSE